MSRGRHRSREAPADSALRTLAFYGRMIRASGGMESTEGLVMGRHSAPVEATHHTRNAIGALTLVGAGMGSVAVAQPALADEASQSEWDAIVHCESSGRNAENPTSSASGYFQIIDGTWRGAGGVDLTGVTHASQASYADQLTIANRIYTDAGDSFTPWNSSKSCWAPLMGGGAPAFNAPAPTVEAPAPEVAPAPDSSVVVSSEPVPMTNAYTVVSGDCLSGIAHFYGVTTAELYLANRDVVGGNPNLIVPGQVLRIEGTISTGNHVADGGAHCAGD
jgi:LysM repeat protein